MSRNSEGIKEWARAARDVLSDFIEHWLEARREMDEIVSAMARVVFSSGDRRFGDFTVPTRDAMISGAYCIECQFKEMARKADEVAVILAEIGRMVEEGAMNGDAG